VLSLKGNLIHRCLQFTWKSKSHQIWWWFLFGNHLSKVMAFTDLALKWFNDSCFFFYQPDMKTMHHIDLCVGKADLGMAEASQSLHSLRLGWAGMRIIPKRNIPAGVRFVSSHLLLSWCWAVCGDALGVKSCPSTEPLYSSVVLLLLLELLPSFIRAPPVTSCRCWCGVVAQGKGHIHSHTCPTRAV